MKKAMLAMTMAAMLAVPMATQAQADNRPVVAVLDFNNGSIQPELAPLSKGFADMLITQLGTNTRIRVVERANLQHILDEQKLSATGQVDAATAVRIGKLLGATYMITGGFITDPKRIMQINVRAFEVETGKIIYTDGTAKGPVDNLMDLIIQSATVANSKLNLPQLPAGPASEASLKKTEEAKKVPFQTLMLYSRAIDASDKGDKAGAMTLYKQALDKWPDHQPSKDALAKLQKGD